MFQNIVGQEKITEKLKKALLNRRISHAYLFEGPEGLGKMEIARDLATGLVCQNRARPKCNQCNACKKAIRGKHPDIKIIEDGNIKIEDLRELVREIQLKPYESNHKVYIIQDADKMSIAVQNVLLKTLEEPPSFTSIILLTSKKPALLPTIISRCQVISFYPTGLENIRNYLIKNKNIGEDQAHILAALSAGVIGQALRLLEDADFNHRRERTIKICTYLLNLNLIDILDQLEFFQEERDHIEDIFNIMITWFRDLLVYKETKNVKLTTNVDKAEEFELHLERIGLTQIRDIIFIIEETKDNLKTNVQYNLNIEVMLLNIQEVLANGNSSRSKV